MKANRNSIVGFLLFFLAVLLFAAPVFSAPKKKVEPNAFDAMKKEYLRLRNTDVQVSKIGEWETLAAKFDTYVTSHPSDANAPSALFNSAVLYEQIYRKVGGEDRLRKSADYLDRLVKDYPLSPLADDALIRKGDYLLYDLDRPEEASVVYQQVWDKYPQGDMRQVARARLRFIDSGGYKAWQSAERAPIKPVKKDPLRKVLVVIDPGHGGEDFGAEGPGGLLEKDVALAVALELERLLLTETGIGVRLTRRKDVFVPLVERIQFANDYQADLFISIHSNASPRAHLSGVETYYLDNTKDEASRLLAERENATVKTQVEQHDLQFILSDLIQNTKLEESVLLANILQRDLVNYMRARLDGIKDLGVKKAPFYVLVGAHMPCALTEVFFIDNEVDGDRLGKKEFRNEVAEGLRRGVMEFLKRQRMIS